MKNIKKKAFTLLEIIFVVVIIGIISAVLAPRVKRDTIKEAADQLAAHIRYTQYLALQDNKFNNSDQYWYRGRWQLVFGKSAYTDNKYAYTIFSDKPTYAGNPNLTEVAINPLNPNQFLSGGYTGFIKTSDKRAMKELNIGKKYDITNVDFSPSCSYYGSRRIAFDYLGRPIKGNLQGLKDGKYKNRLIETDCIITITNSIGESKKIIITPETGYVYIK